MQTKHLCVLIHIWTKCEVGASLNRYKPSIKIFLLTVYWRCFFCGSFILFSVLFCYTFMHVCLLMPCGHLLEKGWPLGSRLWCLIMTLSLSHCYPGSGVVLYRFLIFALFLTFIKYQQLYMCIFTVTSNENETFRWNYSPYLWLEVPILTFQGLREATKHISCDSPSCFQAPEEKQKSALNQPTRAHSKSFHLYVKFYTHLGCY